MHNHRLPLLQTTVAGKEAEKKRQDPTGKNYSSFIDCPALLSEGYYPAAGRHPPPTVSCGTVRTTHNQIYAIY